MGSSGEARAPTRSFTRDLRRAATYLRPYRGRIALVLALTLASSSLPAIEPLVHRALFDRLAACVGAAGGGARAIAGPIALLLALVVVRQVAEGVTAILAWRVRLRVNRDLLAEATARLHALPLSYHQGHGVGDTMTRLDRGITSFVEGLSSVAFQALPALVYVVLSLAIMLRLSPALALLSAAFVAPAVLLGRGRTAELVERERQVLDLWCAVYNRFQQVLAGIKTVKAFAREADEHAHFVAQVASAQREVLTSVGLQTKLAGGRSLSVNAGRVAVLGAGAWLVAEGRVGVGTLVAFLGYVGGLYGPAQALLGLYETARRTELGLETVFGVLDAEDGVPDAPGALAPASLAGDIAFERVTFRHGPTCAPAREDVSLHVRPGELVAIVGPSGAGKTTLADLVLRLHDPTAGAVRIDGHDLRDLTQRTLRRTIGVVTQEAFLFEDTILANLRYGRPGATIAEVRAAARAARCDGFIERLPGGYEARVGRGGVELSGGERQRIAIARTLLKNPSILVLDEPTSALDVEGEAAVQEALERLSAGRTTLLIAHRLSTTLRADRVVVLDRGRVVEEGPPAELLRGSGPFRRMMDLWQSASRGPRRRSDSAPALAGAI